MTNVDYLWAWSGLWVLAIAAGAAASILSGAALTAILFLIAFVSFVAGSLCLFVGLDT